MTNREIMRYYRIYEYQSTEEEIVAEYRYPEPPAKPKKLPKPDRMAELVRERMMQNHGK